MSDKKRCILVLGLAVLIYFVSYPDDVQDITTPLSTFLNLTKAISPLFYGLVAVGIIAAAMVKTWGRRTGA
jgi:Na+/proline symporter